MFKQQGHPRKVPQEGVWEEEEECEGRSKSLLVIREALHSQIQRERLNQEPGAGPDHQYLLLRRQDGRVRAVRERE